MSKQGLLYCCIRMENIRLLTFISCSALFFLLETIWPFKPHTEPRPRHISKNMTIAVINAVIYGFTFGIAANWTIQQAEQVNFGLFHWIHLSYLQEIIIAVIILDFVVYLWHILLHRLPFLWRFHLVHHVDTRLDFSSGTRFHLGEMLGSMIFHLPWYFILGISLDALIINQVCMIIFTQFGHSNLKLPKWLDEPLRTIFVTSNFHQVHHSNIPHEFHSNYGHMLSIWDRLIRTYTARRDVDGVTTGIKKYPPVMTLGELMWLPFKRR